MSRRYHLLCIECHEPVDQDGAERCAWCLATPDERKQLMRRHVWRIVLGFILFVALLALLPGPAHALPPAAARGLPQAPEHNAVDVTLAALRLPLQLKDFDVAVSFHLLERAHLFCHSLPAGASCWPAYHDVSSAGKEPSPADCAIFIGLFCKLHHRLPWLQAVAAGAAVPRTLRLSREAPPKAPAPPARARRAQSAAQTAVPGPGPSSCWCCVPATGVACARRSADTTAASSRTPSSANAWGWCAITTPIGSTGGRCIGPARMFLNVKDLKARPSEIVAHECGHAAMAWARLQRANLRQMLGEEVMCYALGRLVAQVNRVCFASGAWS